MKNQGVTMLQIVITIIIMVILAMVVIFYGQETPREARTALVFNEIRTIESAINEAYIMNKIKVKDDSLEFYGEIEVPKVNKGEYVSVIGNDASGDFYYLDFTTSRKLENVFDAENIKNDYLFDYDNLTIYLIKGLDFLSGDTSVTKYSSNDIKEHYNKTYNNR